MSLLLADGVPLHKVSALLGHASISIMADLYGHLAKSDCQRDTSESMARLFGKDESARGSPEKLAPTLKLGWHAQLGEQTDKVIPRRDVMILHDVRA